MAFPKGFFIGAATAAHQVEGNNIHSDYWAQELLPHSSFTEPSGIACDHYNRYEEDIRLLAEAGLNAYRFSVEWARIEPEEGEFDASEIEHYRRVIACCRANGVEPIVTLMHFTSPVWLIRKGGWEAESTVEYFRRYAAYVMNFEKMMENMKYSAAENAGIFGTPQPQIFVSSRTPEGDALVFRAHQAAKTAIKTLYPNIQVGITLSVHDCQALPGGESFAEAAWEEEFRHYLPYIRDDDFLGVQNYTRTLYGPQGQLPAPEGAELTQMDYEFYPEALEHVIRKVHDDFKGNLIVTENGVAISDDNRRVEFIRRALCGVENCVDDGIPVKGYCYWSLMDNFEWQKGFSMTFGLIAVDRTTLKRTPKKSLSVLGQFHP